MVSHPTRSPAEIARLLEQGEGPRLEFKVATPLPESLSRLISGFANAEGGTVIVGIREPNVVAGTDIDRFNRLVPLATKRLHGEVQVDHHVIQLNGKPLGIIDVQRSKVPVASPEGYFRRVGDREEPLGARQLVERMSELPDHGAAITSLSETISSQSTEFAKLQEAFEKANSWKRKAFYALIGALATAVVKVVLAAVGIGGG
jgi:predicted HTH transcriptional regulator